MDLRKSVKEQDARATMYLREIRTILEKKEQDARATMCLREIRTILEMFGYLDLPDVDPLKLEETIRRREYREAVEALLEAYAIYQKVSQCTRWGLGMI